MGQTMPALCTECGGKYGYVLAATENEAEAVQQANERRNAAMEKWKAAGFVGDLNDY